MTASLRTRLTPVACLPADARDALLIGRLWVPALAGPVLVRVDGDDLIDITAIAATATELFERPGAATEIRARSRPRIGTLAAALANASAEDRNLSAPWLLAPCDLQAIKAAGVTFVASMLERVIEEQTRGDPAKAEGVRRKITGIIGDNLRSVEPGSPAAARVKDVLLAEGLWSQYLEVGIGPDAEIFTKSQPMSAVGAGADIGIHRQSTWTNPEPEIGLAVTSSGETAGATLGSDVHLRDFEGRSALLLGKAKDNNASCAIGPFIRLFDDNYSIDDVRRCDLAMRIEGDEGFALTGNSPMSLISRDPLNLVSHAIG